MREIKFRAWDPTRERMLKEQRWVEFYVTSISELQARNYGWGNKGLQELEVLQYTGLKDRNGVEIYEGDIVRWDAQEWGSEYSETVTWDYELLNMRKNDWPQWCEVIGNIHEHPHLLDTQEGE